VPKIYTWNSDTSNPVGAGYMIMEKVIGSAAFDIQDDLSWEGKEDVVTLVARHLMSISELRFALAGYLYL